MIRSATYRHRPVRVRGGFTLVELLIVIVVIAVLIGLLLPAINGALRTARNAAVTSEMGQFAQALASFKSQYGVYPPSRIIVSEDGDYSIATIESKLGLTFHSATLMQQRSISYLRRIWPRMVLSTSGPVNGVASGTLVYDFDGNGAFSPMKGIQGSECMVFFLGGLPGYVDSSPTPNVVTGFAKNPVNPMQNNVTTSNRTPGTFEFRPGRFVDVDNNGFPEYLDNLGGSNPRFYVYFSAYEGQGYDPDDNNYYDDPINDVNASGNAVYVYGGFMTPNAATPTNNVTTRPDIVSSPAPNPYTNSLPLPTTAGGDLNTADTTPRDYINKSTFQILSAGIDNLFGIGGAYQTKNVDSPLTFPMDSSGSSANFGATGANYPAGIRYRENDNLTNFTTGKMN